MASSYTALEQNILSELGPGAVPSFSTSAAVDLFTTTNFLYSMAIMIIVVVAGWRYMLAGVWRMQASQTGMTKSNNEFRRVTLGLLGVLSLFLILYTFNKGLLKGDVGLEGLRSSKAEGGSLSTVVPKATTTPGSQPFIPANNDDPKGWNAIKEDPAMRAQLASLPNGGISVNKNVCITPTQTGCTTVGGWDAKTPAMLAQLRSACPAGRIMVTGGTEAGHKSHGTGKTSVDLSLNDSGLESCIRSFPVGPTLTWCKKTYVNFGFMFCDENLGISHWHVQ